MKVIFCSFVLASSLVVCLTGNTQESKTYGDLPDIKPGDTSKIGHMSHGSSGSSNASKDARDSVDRRPVNSDIPSSDYSSRYYVPGAADSRRLAKSYNANGHKAFEARIPDYSEALDDYEAAVLLDPDNDDYKCNRDLALAMLAYRKGYYHQAIQNMRKVINQYNFREPWVMRLYSKINDRDDGEREGRYKVTKGGDHDCPSRKCQWREYGYIKPSAI
jgi:hypothetical protein